MVTMGVSGLLAFVLLGYLKLVSSQYSSTVRSQAWNLAMPVAEAGIEEALTHLYYNGPANLATNGWSYSNGDYVKERVVGDSQYQVHIRNAWLPVIYSTGTSPLPVGGGYVSRRIRVTARRSALFAKGMVAKSQIDIYGNNVGFDSFDSADPDHSTQGRYDPTKAKDNGDVATNSSLTNSLALGNADVKGKVATGPGGSIDIGPNGAVGDAAWHASGQHGIKPGWSSDDMNVSFPDVTQPFTSGYMVPTRQLVDGVWVDHVLNSSGNWLLSNQTGSILVKSNVNAVLLLTGDLKISGQNYIRVQSGASLKLYVKGSTADISGLGAINSSGNASNLFYYGLPSNTSLTMTGNGQFTGVIYAPEADFHLGGGGSDIQDFIGASVSSTVQMNGHFNFHYDENLGRIEYARGYIVTSWNEVPVDYNN